MSGTYTLAIGTSGIFGGIVLTVLLILGLVALWAVFGRKKKAEDKAIGLLEQMAHFKATNSVDAMQRRIR